MPKTAIALIAKAPVAGKVKTRFTPPCTPEQAADFARAFLLDTAAAARSCDADLWVSYLGDAELLVELLGDVSLLEQRGSDLDDRLANAADDLFARGYEQVVLFGADCPTVDAGYLSSALDGLGAADVVLGPADDGGYTLIAMKAPEPRLFVGIEMSTERVARETLQRADECGLTTLVLDTRFDIDTLDALRSANAAVQLDHATHTLAQLKLLGSPQ